MSKFQPQAVKHYRVLAALEQLGDSATDTAVARTAGVSRWMVRQIRGGSGRAETLRRNAFEKLNLYINCSLEGTITGLGHVTGRRGRWPSLLAYSLLVAAERDVEEWCEVLERLSSAALRLRDEIKKGAD